MLVALGVCPFVVVCGFPCWVVVCVGLCVLLVCVVCLLFSCWFVFDSWSCSLFVVRVVEWLCRWRSVVVCGVFVVVMLFVVV
jgi:hypothetical protein